MDQAAHKQQARLSHSAGGGESEMKAFGRLSGVARTFSLCPGMGEELRVPQSLFYQSTNPIHKASALGDLKPYLRIPAFGG